MALPHWEAGASFTKRWFPNDERLSQEHKIVDCIYKQFLFVVILLQRQSLGDACTVIHRWLLPPLIKASCGPVVPGMPFVTDKVARTQQYIMLSSGFTVIYSSIYVAYPLSRGTHQNSKILCHNSEQVCE